MTFLVTVTLPKVVTLRTARHALACGGLCNVKKTCMF
jgi:hypothetical protein